MDLEIYVITHKKTDIALPENYQKLLVGAAIHPAEGCLDEYVLDNSYADNISLKNSNYCELTGLYWIWKHDTNPIKGLVHYRRFFTKNRFSNSTKYFYSKQDINKLLNEYEMIVGERVFVDAPDMKTDYLVNHKIKDWELLKRIIREKHDRYLDAFEQMEKGNWFFPYNMMIAKEDVLDKYLTWLFDILSELEQVVDLTDYDVQQARIYGFLSERLLGIWLAANNVRYYEAPILQTDCRFRYRVRRKLERIFGKKMKKT